jgi:sialate O-acetylesterase
MVLQQGQDVAFWGKYTPEGKVSISTSWGEEATVIPDETGNWSLTLSTPEAGGPFEVSIVTKDSTIVLDDVMVGEVWLASGQSNMEMPVKGWPPNDLIENSDEEITNANYPGIRMFTVARNFSTTPIDTITGIWASASPETAGDFSATAYFFARRLHQELGVPIGIIHSSWGGTVAEAWTSVAGLRKLGDFDQAIDDLQNAENQDAIDSWFESRATLPIPDTEEEWQTVSFSGLEAAALDFDDSNWDSIDLPGRFDQLSSGQFNGAMWLRKEFTVEDVSSDYVLKIGSIDDMDATYINGEKIGGLAGPGFWNVAREYTVPKTLMVQGTNIIAIRAIDTGGPGAVFGPMTLSNGSTEITLEGSWKHQLIAEFYQNKLYVYDLQTDISIRPNVFQMNPNMPTVLFNAMIDPLVPYTIRGAIWYQGESNVGRDEQYKRLFPGMIEDWRSQWDTEFPFYFVQIAPFTYNPDPELQISQKLRDAQRYSLNTPKTGMVVTLDIGNITNIHPGNKQDVGARLAGLALANDYGKDIVASGPLYKSHEVSGNKIILEFDYVGSGLMVGDQELTGFEIAGSDKVYVDAKSMIVGDRVEVSSASITTPLYVRYAWRDTSIATLFNKEGFPASSFTSED